jgi:NAD(P)-dependent dehydrogenase (short-subunit alcohol dehydrogenase family)
MAQHFSHILITGASSGIGAALAQEFAQPGVQLALIGRNTQRLKQVAALVRAKGGDPVIGEIDVRDGPALKSWILELDARHPFDLVIANAGITTGLAPGALQEDPEAVRGIFAINLFGALNTIEPLIGPMSARGHGRLAMVGSIAGVRGLPYSPAYCMTKAALRSYAESLRGTLQPKGVGVSLICPGFIKTPLNDSIEAAKPLEMSAARAAKIIRRGLERGRSLIAFPRLLYWGARLTSMLPSRLVDAVMMRFDVSVPQTTERAKP